jgi:N-acylneuraminate cytidylyltransferase
MKHVAIIPARGGSKRIPRKNVRSFFDKPLICHVIETALKAEVFARVIVSTEDDEIAEVARKAGAETPFERPQSLADDHGTTAAVIAHAVQFLLDEGMEPDGICCIYPTAPMMTVEDLQQGRQLFEEGRAEFVCTVTTFPSPIEWALRITPEGNTAMLNPEHVETRSQDLEERFLDAGQLYWGKPEAWLAQRSPVVGARPLMLPRWRVQDIDTPEDWEMAERLFALSRSAES